MAEAFALGDQMMVPSHREWGELTVIATDGTATVRVRGSRGERFRIGRDRLERAAEVPRPGPAAGPDGEDSAAAAHRP